MSEQTEQRDAAPAAKSANLFYAWEFGANLGHIGAFLPLARALKDHGHRVHWAVTDTAAAARLLPQEGFTWFQAPRCEEHKRPGPPLTYADILLRFGYQQAADLLGLVVAWRELLKLTRADLVLVDHAPTALLAARTLGLPVMQFSNGFTVPPRQRPLPNMRPWQPLPAEQLLALEDAALASVNAVLAHFGRAPLPALATLFDVAEEALITYPELDHYESRGPARYWGSLPAAPTGLVPPWPPLTEAGRETPATPKKIFAYLRPEIPLAEAALRALGKCEASTVIYCPGINPAAREALQSSLLVFVDSPVNLQKAAAEADLAVTYASLATTTAFLLAGKPLLLLPSHLEQFLLARRVAAMGAGLVANPEQPPQDFLPLLQDLLDKPDYRANAQAFAAKYAHFQQDQVIANLVRRVDELCAVAATEHP
jgi:UDP:flavonoid glycosyltransferase YjiC (YdhE family)